VTTDTVSMLDVLIERDEVLRKRAHFSVLLWRFALVVYAICFGINAAHGEWWWAALDAGLAAMALYFVDRAVKERTKIEAGLTRLRALRAGLRVLRGGGCARCGGAK
jgi:hypothetical protein